jgi:hypothetical protein
VEVSGEMILGAEDDPSPHQVPKSNDGGINASLHYSTTPLFQSRVRRSESDERNEADEFFHRPESNPR